ncbi:hypothetical protein V1290_000216 [Bradyrhizobium sp. AZCC 1578]|uniref:hypothetical protein n=1 Tax=Bradyrhizobium sp. AZCC 1578 TaxID=3117027 RepID=UPI002FF289B9
MTKVNVGLVGFNGDGICRLMKTRSRLRPSTCAGLLARSSASSRATMAIKAFASSARLTEPLQSLRFSAHPDPHCSFAVVTGVGLEVDRLDDVRRGRLAEGMAWTWFHGAVEMDRGTAQ